MNLEPLWRLYARWFKPAPPAPPPEMPPVLREMIAALKDEAAKRLASQIAAREAPAASEQPDVDAPKWSWQEYVSNRDKAGVHPGWAFCRFANRAYGNLDRNTEIASFVFGFVRGAFGVWSRHMDVCAVNDGGEHESAQQLLTTITHLPSGYGVGVFAELNVAMEAAELAERVYPWATDDVMNPEGRDRTSQAWAGVGIMISTNAHAHSPESPLITLPIYGRSEASVLAGKPEKLS